MTNRNHRYMGREISDDEGYMLELASEIGFQESEDEDKWSCTSEQLLNLIKRVSGQDEAPHQLDEKGHWLGRNKATSPAM